MSEDQAGPPHLSSLRAELLLVHPPAVFEFRNRRDIYFPFLGTSGDVPITPLYEYFPVGFKTLQRYLGDRDHEVRLLNLATLFTRYPKLSLEAVASALDVRVLGLDLHWMIHVQGALEIAEQLKKLRPDIAIILGGISATYYADELIRYPFVDYVMRGYDTHAPMHDFMSRLKSGKSLHEVENLIWKEDGQIRENAFSHLPNTFGCGIDWSQQPEAPPRKGLPILEVLSTQNAGCAYNCPWCGGSRDAFRRIFKKTKAMARKPIDEIAYEMKSAQQLTDAHKYHFYSVGSYNEPKSALLKFLDFVEEAPFRSISYEQFHLTSEEVLKRMVQANAHTSITLSPESHDPHIAKLSGRGVFTNDEMERWLDRALEIGIHAVDVWFFIGMPEQTEKSCMETVEYCDRLLEKFKGRRVNPMICPMIPMLDPASNIFEEPEKYGYKIFYRTAEEHRRGLEHASLINRLNYETKWLSRSDLVRVGFRAVKALMQSKEAHGQLPGRVVKKFSTKVDDAWDFLQVVHEADNLLGDDRTKALEALGDDIVRRNDAILFNGVANQAFPINRPVGGRWFDELGFSVEELERFSAS